MNEVSKSRKPLQPILYKYCPPERIDIICGYRILFSPPSNFNDTFDTRFIPPVPEMKMTLSSTRKKELSLLRQRDQFGIFCLTEDANNHLMWVNYAKNHTGFVIGFRTSSPCFQAGGARLQDVKYEFPPSDSPEEDACFYKTTDGKYEKEWRCVRTFGDAEDRLVTIDDPKLIVQIIFGHSMKDGDISEIVFRAENLTRSHSRAAVAFFQSTPDNSNRTFVNEPKMVECCNHCHGKGYRIGEQRPDE